jgi:hypothetical protein
MFRLLRRTIGSILVVLYASIQQKHQHHHHHRRIVSAMSPNFNFRNAGRIAPFGFPDPSRTIPTSTSIHTDDADDVIISSRCSCGSVLIEFPYPKTHTTAAINDVVSTHSIIDCHCVSCRRFHMSAFVRYVEVPANGVSVSGDSVVRFQDTCSEAGSVQRTYCRRCLSKLLTSKTTASATSNTNDLNSVRSQLPPGKSTVLVNMGPIHSEGIPTEIIEHWKHTKIRQWSPNMEASWNRATLPPSIKDESDYDQEIKVKPPPVTVTGGCTCGACQYEFQFVAPSEMQHCYCNLCRQLSGGMFMTWVPVSWKEQKFRWIQNAYVTSIGNHVQQRSSVPDTAIRNRSTGGNDVPLVRYTDIGQRHMCAQCGSNLSILYDVFAFDDYDDDEDDAVIWLSAAGFDSIRFPFLIEPYLSRLLHICCRFKPDWYTLPKDGIHRVQDAS